MLPWYGTGSVNYRHCPHFVLKGSNLSCLILVSSSGPLRISFIPLRLMICGVFLFLNPSFWGLCGATLADRVKQTWLYATHSSLLFPARSLPPSCLTLHFQSHMSNKHMASLSRVTSAPPSLPPSLPPRQAGLDTLAGAAANEREREGESGRKEGNRQRGKH